MAYSLNTMSLKNLVVVTALFFVYSTHVAQTQTVGVFVNSALSLDGYSLIAPIKSTETYLIDNCGQVVNQWSSDNRVGLAAYLLEDGSLLRTAELSSTATPAFSGGGTGGRVERFSWEGDLIWSMNFADTMHHSHHDLEMLPNGNILVILWESHRYEDALALGKNTNNTENPVWCPQIVEISPTGNEGGEIVWSWSAWDHLIQDTDPALPNYGVISENPRRFNINYTTGGGASNGAGASDWMHCNSVDYNSDLDQIIVSSAKFSEFWIIDHNTTTEEAATTSGDILYRYGNSAAYERGTSDEQLLYHQHDAQWIEDGIDAGSILVFNNGKQRPEGEYSSVEVIELPSLENGTYPIEEGQAFGPTNYSWHYPETFDALFYAQNISGANRLSNGNTLICNGPAGYAFEVTPEEEIVWAYVNPVSGFGPAIQGQDPGNNAMFRAYKYETSYTAFNDKDMTPGEPLEGSGWDTGCTLAVSSVEQLNSGIQISPNPTSGRINIRISEDLIGCDVRVYDARGVEVWVRVGKLFEEESFIDLNFLSKGCYHLVIQSGFFVKSTIIMIQ